MPPDTAHGVTPRLRIGVDSGGTFTDICLFDEASGAIHVWKVSSTPDDPSRAIAHGVVEGMKVPAGAVAGAAVPEVTYFGHGTTVATNALIQHRGAPTGLVTTAGFRDLLEIARQRRPALYDLQAIKPPPLVRRDKRVEVRERMLPDGSVATPLDEAGVRAAARHLKELDVKAVAICFLHSYVNPAHEAEAKRILAEELPGVFVSASHEVAPEFREYERLSTVVINAYLGPVMSGYISRLRARLGDIGIAVQPHLTQSNGGVISFETAAESPVRTILSGPSTGIIGALHVAELAGFKNVITFDMGGTSTDVALIEGGKPKLAGDATVHGYPIKAPMLDINTVGAGGGSIAYVDNGGLLKVGPHSAGAAPGPICYGRGGTEPTVTDANVVLQVLNPTHLLGGRMTISQAAARDAIARLGVPIGLDAIATAQGIISVVTANMAKAIRVISVQRGYDVREYSLVAFGGAGPLHAARLARELEIPRIVVPKHPGILCAMGLLLTDLRTNASMTRLLPLEDAALGAMREAMDDLERRAAEWFAREDIPASARVLSRQIDLRYVGQNYEFSVPLPDGPIVAAMLPLLREGFERMHRQMYGYVAPEAPVQMTTFRVEATGIVRKAVLPVAPPAAADAAAAIVGRREIYFPETGGFVSCPVYDRDRLQHGNQLSGPAVIDQMDSTTLLLPQQTARIDAGLNIIIESGSA